jgi:hypothetical protein
MRASEKHAREMLQKQISMRANGEIQRKLLTVREALSSQYPPERLNEVMLAYEMFLRGISHDKH